MLYPVDCGALPTVAWPDRGLSSLSYLPAPTTTKMWDKKTYSTLCKFIEDYSRHTYKPGTHTTSTRSINRNEPNLPTDPRQWSRDDVARWIESVISTHQLPKVQLDRFLMNGKALCLMSIDMFVSRVPLGGKLLYKDFQLRLSRALYS